MANRRGSRSIEHLGSAHDEAELAALKVAAAERLAANQAVLDLEVTAPAESEPLPITSTRMIARVDEARHPWRFGFPMNDILRLGR